MKKELVISLAIFFFIVIFILIILSFVFIPRKGKQKQFKFTDYNNICDRFKNFKNTVDKVIFEQIFEQIFTKYKQKTDKLETGKSILNADDFQKLFFMVGVKLRYKRISGSGSEEEEEKFRKKLFDNRMIEYGMDKEPRYDILLEHFPEIYERYEKEIEKKRKKEPKKEPVTEPIYKKEPFLGFI